MGSPLPYGMKQGNVRRRSHVGNGLKRYNKVYTKAFNGKLFLRKREQEFAEAFVEGFLTIGPSLLSAGKKRIGLVLRKLAMDCVGISRYRCKTESAFNKQALYLMNMPRVQREMDRLMSDRGMGKEKIAAKLAEIMDGRATQTITISRSGENSYTETRKVGASIDQSLKAIDISLRITGSYAPTSSKVTWGADMGNMFDADTFDATPEIAIPESIALEAKAEKEQEQAEEDDGGVEGEEEDDGPCEDCGKDYDDCECEYDDEGDEDDDKGHE